MPFIETEASVRYETINGKRVPVITPKTEVTLTNTETGKEYMSDAEALADVQNPERTQIAESFRRMTVFSNGSVPLAEQDLHGRGCVGNVDSESVMDLWRRVIAARRRALREHGPQSPLVRTFQS